MILYSKGSKNNMADQRNFLPHPDQRTSQQLLKLILDLMQEIENLRTKYHNYTPPFVPLSGWEKFFLVLGGILGGGILLSGSFYLAWKLTQDYLVAGIAGALIGVGSGLVLTFIWFGLKKVSELIINAWNDRKKPIHQIPQDCNNDLRIRNAITNIRQYLTNLTIEQEGGHQRVINCGSAALERRVLDAIAHFDNYTIHQLEALGRELQTVYLARQEQEAVYFVSLGQGIAAAQQDARLGSKQKSGNSNVDAVVAGVLNRVHAEAKSKSEQSEQQDLQGAQYGLLFQAVPTQQQQEGAGELPQAESKEGYPHGSDDVHQPLIDVDKKR